MSTPDLVSLFVAPLSQLGVTYMVTGAVAAIIYGEPRLTNDIDLVIKLSDDDAVRLHRAFAQSEFYVPPVEVMQAEAHRAENGHFNLIHTATALKADIYPVGTDLLHQWAMERRRQVSVAGETLWIAPLEYVILRKLQYLEMGGQDKHRYDIRSMLATSGAQLDRDFLLAEIERLRLGEVWSTVELR